MTRLNYFCCISTFRNALFAWLLCAAFQSAAQSSVLVGGALEGGAQFGAFLQYIPGSSTLQAQLNLTGTVGGVPTNSLPVEYAGKLYGTTQEGGTHGLGIIYSYDLTSNAYAVLHNFTSNTGGACLVSLMLATNNKLYGSTTAESSPGVHKGSIFEFDPATNIFINKYNFLQTDGFRPVAGFTEHAGKLYILASNGGASSLSASGGSIIEYILGATSIIVKFKFTGSGTVWPNGRNPQGALTKVNGKMYGVTFTGATGNVGSVFEYLPGATAVTVRAHFGAAAYQRPSTSLVQGSNGLLYGITATGGDSALGAIFSFDTTTYALANRYSFRTSQGRSPLAALFKASNDLLYGTTAAGGAGDQGTIYQLNTATHTYTLLHSFNPAIGNSPLTGMGQLTTGSMYSTCNSGAVAGKGVLFNFNIMGNALTVLTQFGGAANGAQPSGRLFLAANSKLYALTQIGGDANRGTVVQYNAATNTYNKLAQFADTNGAQPRGTLLQAPNGKLYGVTQRGGTGSATACAGGCGTLFEFDTTTNGIVKRIDFGGAIGDAPVGQLVYDTGTKMFGTCVLSSANPGANFGGLIYEYNYATNAIVARAQFTATTGDYPQSGMIKASNGLMYGVTTSGGNATMQAGTLYEFNPMGFALTKKIEFLGISNGANPSGELLQATTGSIFGTTEKGGANDLGTIFKYNVSTNVLTKLADFTTTLGSFPTGKLVQATDGHLYGMCSAGGVGGFGTIFKLDTTTGTLTKMVNLQALQGRLPLYNGFTELILPCGTPVTSIHYDTAYLTYTLPWGTAVTTSGTYTHSYSLASGCDSISNRIVYIHTGVKVAVRLLLSACYDAGTLLCNDSLRQKNVVPLVQPYGTAPYTNLVHSGTETTTSAVLSNVGANAIVDWVLLQWRSSSNPALLVATRAALLQRDGDIVEVDGTSAVELGLVPSNYFVSVVHRNHLGVMSAAAIALSSVTTTIDFTSTGTANYVYSNHLSNGSFAAQATQASKRVLYAGNCNIASGACTSILTYNASSCSDRLALLMAASTMGSSGNVYSVFDCDMNGQVKFNGLLPDRLVILKSVAQNQARVLHQQLP